MDAMSDALQELDYLVTAEDIAHLNHYHTQQSPAFQRRRTYAGLVITVCGVFGFLTSLALGGAPLLFMAMLIFLGVWVTLGKSGNPSKRHVQHIRQLYEEGQNRALFGHHHVRLMLDTIEVSTEYSRGQVKWEGIERVVENDQYIFIYVSALNAYVINKKYFPSVDHAERFFAVARSRHEHALQLTGQTAPEATKLLPPPHTKQERPKVPSHAPTGAPQLAHAMPKLTSPGGSGGTDGSL